MDNFKNFINGEWVAGGRQSILIFQAGQTGGPGSLPETVVVGPGPALHVMRASAGGGILKSHGVGSPRVVQRQLEALDVNGVFRGHAAEPSTDGPDPLSQKFPYPLALAHLHHHLYHGLLIAPDKLDAAGVGFGQEPFLVELHGHSDDLAR